MTEGHGERVERFRALYDAAYPRLMAYTLRRARSRTDAEDVVGDTMLIAWRRLDDVPADERRMAWMYGVARRVLANHYRATDRRDRLTDRLERRAPAEPGDLDTVHEALDRLRPDDREILTLSAWDDLTSDEIAVVLGVSPGAVAVRLHRARSRLARELGRLGVAPPSANSVKSERRSRTPEGVYGIQPGPGEVERE